MTARFKTATAAACALALAACQPGTAEAPQAPAPDATAADASTGDVCIVRYAGSNEISSIGELVQLDVRFRLQANRSGSMAAGGSSRQLEADSLVEGSSSQLACLWKQRDGSPDRIDLKRPGGKTRFPGTVEGIARLTGVRTTTSEGMTAQEEVDVSGPLEVLAIQQVGVRDTPESPVCVILAFDAPLHGRSVRTLTAPGINRTENIAPSSLVLDGYSALSPASFSADDHRFLDHSFTICTGEPARASAARSEGPRGLSISPDGRLWQRSGVWSNHASGPAETRVVDFSMRVVPPQAKLRTALQRGEAEAN